MVIPIMKPELQPDVYFRKIREQVKAFLEESRIMVIVNLFRNGLWPGGKLKPPSVPRTPDEKLKTRDDANRKLSSLVPGVFSLVWR
jgi:sorting nexin-25